MKRADKIKETMDLIKNLDFYEKLSKEIEKRTSKKAQAQQKQVKKQS